jgi:peroxiredoxin/nitroreductase
MIESRYKLVPKFVLKDENEKDFSWTNLLGKYSVVYFYPKANTPGCTLEGRGFTKFLEEFNGNVIGISPDDCKAIASFKSKKGLSIKLLSDFDKSVARQFGVLNNGNIIRSTFIVDPWGRIRKEWIKVSVIGHAEDVLKEYKKIIEEDQILNDNILVRRAFRGIRPEPIEDNLIETLLKAAHLAPSCMNKQPWRFLVVRTKENLEKLHETLSGGNYWMKSAPVMIIVYTDNDLGCQLSDSRNYSLFDTGTAVGFLLTQATQMGLIAHPVAGYDPIKIKEIFGISGTVITVIAIGYWGNTDILSEKHFENEFKERIRKPLEEVAKFI